jgi:hypothetical protein
MNTVESREGNGESASFIHQSGYMFIDFHGCQFEQGSGSSPLTCDVRESRTTCALTRHDVGQGATGWWDFSRFMEFGRDGVGGPRDRQDRRVRDDGRVGGIGRALGAWGVGGPSGGVVPPCR